MRVPRWFLALALRFGVVMKQQSSPLIPIAIAVILVLAVTSVHAAGAEQFPPPEAPQQVGQHQVREQLARTPPASEAPVQPRTELGAGLGVARISEAGNQGALLGVSFHARAGWRVGHRLRVGAEFTISGLNDEEPRDSDLSTNEQGFIVVNRIPTVAQTRTLLAFVQITTQSGFHVRPAFGIGCHRYAYYGTYPTITAAEGGEWGPVVSLAAGRGWRVSPRFGLAVEGFFVLSAGEDSTSRRLVFGVRALPLFGL